MTITLLKIVALVVTLPLYAASFILGLIISPIKTGIQDGMDWMETPPQ